MPDPSLSEDQAARYLLGELEGAEKLEFEAQLAASPSLRAQLLDLESACAALALAAPARQPSARAWKKIAREIAAAPQPRPASHTRPSWMPSWLPSWRELVWGTGWAAAAVIALVWVARPSFPTRSNPAQGPLQLAGTGPNPSSPGPAQPSAVRSTPSSFSNSTTSDTAGLTTRGLAKTTRPEARLASNEWNLLRQRLRDLGTLNQTLAQQIALPPGSARFQVFRLSPTNSPAIATNRSAASLLAVADRRPESNTTQPADSATLQSLLTQALARELAVAVAVPVPTGSVPFVADLTSKPTSPTPSQGAATPTPETPSTPAPSAVSGTSDASPPTPPATSSGGTEIASNGGAFDSSGFAVVDLLPPGFTGDDLDLAPPTTFASRNNAAAPPIPTEPAGPSDAVDSVASEALTSALGVYSSETGVGSIALVTSEGPPAGFAYQFWVVNNQAFTTFSLGTTTHPGGRMVVNFTLDPNLVFSPGFLVTLEPVGGSAFPTGPVVVAPPVSLQPKPSPAP